MESIELVIENSGPLPNKLNDRLTPSFAKVCASVAMQNR
jgi:hypothetical protein